MKLNKCNYLSSFILLFALIILFLFNFFNVKREGVTFSNYDNKKYFTKPWDNFCIPSAPSCQKDFLERPGMIGEFPIGCNCMDIGISKVPPAIPESCYDDQYKLYFK
tara:strand:- start:3179 stop:3499 length:321 start_codon:yes stop_codon:yes gene_type:complete